MHLFFLLTDICSFFSFSVCSSQWTYQTYHRSRHSKFSPRNVRHERINQLHILSRRPLQNPRRQAPLSCHDYQKRTPFAVSTQVHLCLHFRVQCSVSVLNTYQTPNLRFICVPLSSCSSKNTSRLRCKCSTIRTSGGGFEHPTTRVLLESSHLFAPCPCVSMRDGIRFSLTCQISHVVHTGQITLKPCVCRSTPTAAFDGAYIYICAC